VTRLAADVDLRPRRGEGARDRVVRLDEVGGVTLGAHPVPVLPVPRPVQPVALGDVLVVIEIEPLVALGVPRHGERLESAAGERDEVLLERLDTEGVGDLELGRLAVRTLRLDEERAFAPEEARGDAAVVEDGTVEVAENRLVVGDGHRMVVMRSLPRLVRLLMARTALPATHEGRPRRRHRRPRGTQELLAHDVGGDDEDDDEGRHQPRDLPSPDGAVVGAHASAPSRVRVQSCLRARARTRARARARSRSRIACLALTAGSPARGRTPLVSSGR
jgi:hypothetical protein